MKTTPGFTLAELLLAVVLIALVAAMVLPNLLRSRVAAGEAAAITSVREIGRAEVAYQTAFPAIGFASSLDALGPEKPAGACSTRSPQHACLLDGQLARASSPLRSRNGYWFLLTPGNKDSRGVVTTYGVLRFRVPHQQSEPVTSSRECGGQAVLQ
jgi:type IV pilus assembly protein PilA